MPPQPHKGRGAELTQNSDHSPAIEVRARRHQVEVKGEKVGGRRRTEKVKEGCRERVGGGSMRRVVVQWAAGGPEKGGKGRSGRLRNYYSRLSLKPMEERVKACGDGQRVCRKRAMASKLQGCSSTAEVALSSPWAGPSGLGVARMS